MGSTAYQERRGQLATYFDRTASDAWAKLTSDAPVSGIRATVRAGRDAMRQVLLDWLPEDMKGLSLLDAGCGPGQLSVAAAMRGADVTGVDLSPTLLELARERMTGDTGGGSVKFIAGDMLDKHHGTFDHVVAMDSLIHYKAADIAASIAELSTRVNKSILFTFAPRTPLLTVMHTVGGLFPKSDRAPAIEPVSESELRRRIAAIPALSTWQVHRTQRISSGFYKSQAMELRKV